MKSRQRTMNYLQQIEGTPQQIFPLLCPNREKDWLDGWDYEMIYSLSGFAEANCVFTTPMHGKEATVWMVSRYEPEQGIIDFVRFTPSEMIVRISILVYPKNKEITPVEVTYIYTALGEEQEKYLEQQLSKDFRKSMEWWEKAMNYYLRTGEMLRK